MIRKALVISDIHAGSTGGLAPPKLKLHGGGIYHQSLIQGWMWECWTDWQGAWFDKYIGADDFALIVNGDLIEGVHHGTKEVISPEIADHRAAAVECLGPISDKAAKTFVVEGTECHTGISEHSIAAELGATPNPDTGLPAWDRLDITIAETRCIFSHHIGTTSRPYLEASQLSIHMGVERQEAVINGEAPPKVIGRAHRHRYGEFRDAHGLCFVTPPWQMLTRHARKVVAAARCRPGVVLLDWSDTEDGELPETHVMTYRPPQAKGITI